MKSLARKAAGIRLNRQSQDSPVAAFDPYHAAIAAPAKIRPDGKSIGPAAYAVKQKSRSNPKSTLRFNRLLPKYDDESAKAWLYGKLLVALLVEKLIHNATAVSPWGYRVEAIPAAQPVA